MKSYHEQGGCVQDDNDLAMAGRLKIDELVTKRYDLDEADEAFRALAAGEQARGLIVF